MTQIEIQNWRGTPTRTTLKTFMGCESWYCTFPNISYFLGQQSIKLVYPELTNEDVGRGGVERQIRHLLGKRGSEPLDRILWQYIQKCAQVLAFLRRLIKRHVREKIHNVPLPSSGLSFLEELQLVGVDRPNPSAFIADP